MPRTSVYSLVLAVVVTASAHAQAGPRKEIVNPPAEASRSPLSSVVRTGNLLFLSGMLGTKQGAPMDSTIQGQTRQTLENIKGALQGAGATMDDVVKCTVFLTDIKDFQAMNGVYREYFPKDPPARSTVAVAALASATAKIEIECIAAAK